MEGRVLIIEDHQGNRQLIKDRLEMEGFTVAEAATGKDGLADAVRLIPQVIVLSTTLPDLSGVEMVDRLQRINRTKHIFVMLVGDEDDREERLSGLEAGADDFVTYPIDVDLVMLRVRNAIQRANKANQTDPVTGMPAGQSVRTQLLNLVHDTDGPWSLMRMRVRHLNPFREVYGFMAADDLLRGTARIIAAALARDDVEDDYLGYGGRDDFIVITHQSRAEGLIEEVLEQFNLEVGAHYGFLERQKGEIEYEGETYPLAVLRIRQVTPEDGPFYDIRSLSEALAG